MQFEPGSSHVATVTMTNPSGGAFDYEAILYMGIEQAVMAGVPFHLNAGESKEISFNVVMPSTAGEYPVYLSVFSGGVLLKHYEATENVVIIMPSVAEFSIPALIDFWLEHEIIVGNYVHRVTWGVTVTNNGGAPGTATLTIWRSYPEKTYDVSVTLNPGESIFVRAYRTDYQFAYIHQLTFTIDGDWAENNHADGHMNSNGDVDIGNVVLETHREW